MSYPYPMSHPRAAPPAHPRHQLKAANHEFFGTPVRGTTYVAHVLKCVSNYAALVKSPDLGVWLAGVGDILRSAAAGDGQLDDSMWALLDEACDAIRGADLAEAPRAEAPVAVSAAPAAVPAAPAGDGHADCARLPPAKIASVVAASAAVPAAQEPAPAPAKKEPAPAPARKEPAPAPAAQGLALIYPATPGEWDAIWARVPTIGTATRAATAWLRAAEESAGRGDSAAARAQFYRFERLLEDALADGKSKVPQCGPYTARILGALAFPEEAEFKEIVNAARGLALRGLLPGERPELFNSERAVKVAPSRLRELAVQTIVGRLRELHSLGLVLAARSAGDAEAMLEDNWDRLRDRATHIRRLETVCERRARRGATHAPQYGVARARQDGPGFHRQRATGMPRLGAATYRALAESLPALKEIADRQLDGDASKNPLAAKFAEAAMALCAVSDRSEIAPMFEDRLWHLVPAGSPAEAALLGALREFRRGLVVPAAPVV